jgi:hypothetical protein
MGRQSIVDAWLSKFPKERQKEIEQKIRSAPTIRVAHQELKNLKFRGSYDAVQTWRAKDAKSRSEGLSDQASKVTAIAARIPLGGDPIASIMDLAQELNVLCVSLVALMKDHQWLEPGEVRLSNREASKILAAIPSLSRAASGSLIELHRVKAEMDRKDLCLALLEEVASDWRQTLEHDNPELLSLMPSIIAVTKSRLELDRSSLLEDALDGKQS